MKKFIILIIVMAITLSSCTLYYQNGYLFKPDYPYDSNVSEFLFYTVGNDANRVKITMTNYIGPIYRNWDVVRCSDGTKVFIKDVDDYLWVDGAWVTTSIDFASVDSLYIIDEFGTYRFHKV